MILIIGPGALILLALLAFKPVRFVVGWALFLLLCFIVYACMSMPPG